MNLGKASSIEALQIASTTTGSNLAIGSDANLGSIRHIDLSPTTVGSKVTLTGVTQAVSITGSSGADTLTAGSGADNSTGGTGADTYNLGLTGGSNDNAIDTVVEAGSAVTKDATTGAIAGFDLIQQFTKTQDVLTFNGGVGKQLAGT